MLTRHLDTLMISLRTKLAVLGTISALALTLLFGAEAHAQAATALPLAEQDNHPCTIIDSIIPTSMSAASASAP
jgi:hypothetical protein